MIASWSLDVSPWRVPLHLVAWHRWDSKSKCCHPEMTMDGWIRSWIWFWSWTWFCIVVLLTICILCLQSSCDKNDYAYWIHCFGIVFFASLSSCYVQKGQSNLAKYCCIPYNPFRHFKQTSTQARYLFALLDWLRPTQKQDPVTIAKNCYLFIFFLCPFG